jgi:hypothetical protein
MPAAALESGMDRLFVSAPQAGSVGEAVLSLILLVQDEQDDYQDRFRRPP